MSNFALYERVMDGHDGRIGKVIKVFLQNKNLIYRVKFYHSVENFEAEWLRKVKS